MGTDGDANSDSRVNDGIRRTHAGGSADTCDLHPSIKQEELRSCDCVTSPILRPERSPDETPLAVPQVPCAGTGRGVYCRQQAPVPLPMIHPRLVSPSVVLVSSTDPSSVLEDFGVRHEIHPRGPEKASVLVRDRTPVRRHVTAEGSSPVSLPTSLFSVASPSLPTRERGSVDTGVSPHNAKLSLCRSDWNGTSSTANGDRLSPRISGHPDSQQQPASQTTCAPAPPKLSFKDRQRSRLLSGRPLDTASLAVEGDGRTPNGPIRVLPLSCGAENCKSEEHWHNQDHLGLLIGARLTPPLAKVSGTAQVLTEIPGSHHDGASNHDDSNEADSGVLHGREFTVVTPPRLTVTRGPVLGNLQQVAGSGSPAGRWGCTSFRSLPFDCVGDGNSTEPVFTGGRGADWEKVEGNSPVTSVRGCVQDAEELLVARQVPRGSALAAAREIIEKCGMSGLYVSVLKVLRANYPLPFLEETLMPPEGLSSDESLTLAGSDRSLTGGVPKCLTPCVGVGVAKTEEYVFIPRYELLDGGPSPMEVVLDAVRTVCPSFSLSMPCGAPQGCIRSDSCGTPGAGPCSGSQLNVNVGQHAMDEGVVPLVGEGSCHSVQRGGVSFGTAGTVTTSKEQDCFTFGVAAPTYPLITMDDGADESDYKVAARLLFDAQKGTLLIPTEGVVHKYMGDTAVSGACGGAANEGGFEVCSLGREGIGAGGEATDPWHPWKKPPKGFGGRVQAGELGWPSCDCVGLVKVDESSALPCGEEERRGLHWQPAPGEESGSVSQCICSQEHIMKDTRGVDYSRYHTHKLLHHCYYCNRRPASLLCIHCLTALCSSHVTRHYNDSIPSTEDSSGAARDADEGRRNGEILQKVVGDCSLFINILDIVTSFDRIFWCEPCQSFTWRYTEVYEPFVDQLAATRGTYLEDPVRDIVCVGYEVQLKCCNETQASYCGRVSAHSSVPRERPLMNRSALSSDVKLFGPPTEGQDASCVTVEKDVDNSGGSDALLVGVSAPKLISLGAKVQGWRSTQEDAEAAFVVNIPCFSESAGVVGAGGGAACGTIAMAVFCVFDGHGGDAVAKLAASRFEAHLRMAMSSAAHDKGQASAVLRRLDQESATPHYSLSEASPLRPRENGCFPILGNNDVTVSGATAESGVRPASTITVEMLRQHTEGSICRSPAAGNTEGDSETSGTYHGSSTSLIVSRREMELLRQYFASVMEEAFLSLDSELRSSNEGRRGDYNCAGCTACVVGITTNFILCANVGDSGAAFYTPQGIQQISMTHRTTDPAERVRINNAGYALVEHRIEGLLAVSRALGDDDFKQCGAKGPREQAVTPVPDVTIMPLPPAAGAAAGRWGVVVACDGVWDTLTLRQVHHAIMNTPNDLEVASSATDAVLRAQEISSLLYRNRYSTDGGDISVVGGAECRGGSVGVGAVVSIDAMLLASAAGILAQCVAPYDNEEGVGMDNCSLFLIEQR